MGIKDGHGTTSTYYTLDALLSIAALRRAGCNLAVELWHDHDPVLVEASEASKMLSQNAAPVLFRDFWDVLYIY